MIKGAKLSAEHPSICIWKGNYPLCRFTSYISKAAATAAFSDSTLPSMGIWTMVSAKAAISWLKPFPSFPMRKAAGPPHFAGGGGKATEGSARLAA